MGVDIADPSAEQRMTVDEMENLQLCGGAGMG
jgi:hypothetical protein